MPHCELLSASFLFVSESSSLKSLKIRVPEVVKSGETVTLSCEYDLEEVALYTIKWYWKDVEFYRFVPKESPPFRAFTMKYINVDVSPIYELLSPIIMKTKTFFGRCVCFVWLEYIEDMAKLVLP